MESGAVTVGAVISLTDPTVAELAGYCGMDFIWIDSEHNAFNMESIKNLIISARAGGTAPLVRVRSNDSNLIKPVLDMAPAGVIIPMVSSVESAKAAVAACKYPPVGIRGCGVRRAVGYGAIDFGTYLAESQREPWVIIQIEHIDAVSALDDILQVPGVDSICIGPCDLSGSMGILNKMDDPKLNQILDEASAKVKAAGKILGTAAGDFPRWKARGVNWFAGTSDWGCMAAGFRQLARMKG
ncbi:MAG: hypothetical protein IJJ33_10660 [Victivallales bacterium]|nr:hypothetical protein [Victivallales bacterium]